MGGTLEYWPRRVCRQLTVYRNPHTLLLLCRKVSSISPSLGTIANSTLTSGKGRRPVHISVRNYSRSHVRDSDALFIYFEQKLAQTFIDYDTLCLSFTIWQASLYRPRFPLAYASASFSHVLVLVLCLENNGCYPLTAHAQPPRPWQSDTVDVNLSCQEWKERCISRRCNMAAYIMRGEYCSHQQLFPLTT